MSIPKRIFLSTVLSFLAFFCNANQQANNDQEKLILSFKVLCKDKFDKAIYTKIRKNFGKFMKAAKEAETDDSGFDRMGEILGNPFNHIMAEYKNRDDITCNISFRIEEEKSIELEISMLYDRNTHKQTAWQKALFTASDFFANPNWKQKLVAPIFADAINAGKESGFPGSLRLSIYK